MYFVSLCSRAGRFYGMEFSNLADAEAHADESVKLGGAASAEVLDEDDNCVYATCAS